eukprot:6213455-Pleurochrysis_carterae.AAC.5
MPLLSNTPPRSLLTLVLVDHARLVHDEAQLAVPVVAALHELQHRRPDVRQPEGDKGRAE